MGRNLAALFVIFAVTHFSSASAETRAWEAAKSRLPGKLMTVMSADVDQLRTSAVLQALLPEVTARHEHVGKLIERAKTDCGIDVTTAVTGVVVAIGDDERGAVLVSLAGLNEAKVTACLKKIGKADKKVVTAKKLRGPLGIVEYSAKGSTQRWLAAWPAKDVMAFATEPGDRALLEAMLGGAGVSGDLGTAISRFDRNLAAWGAIASDSFFEPDAKMKAGYATLALAAGQATVQASFVFHSTADAAKNGADMKKQFGKKTSSTVFPPELVKLMNSIEVKHVGDTVSLRVTLPDADILALLRLAHAM
jgi:hypothetical protein